MNKQIDNSHQTLSSGLPEIRYAALGEIQSFLKSKDIELRSLFDVLCKASDCYLNLIFNFGDIFVQFSREFEHCSERGNVVKLSIELHKDKMEKIETYEYEYKVEELEALRKNMRLGIESFGEG